MNVAICKLVSNFLNFSHDIYKQILYKKVFVDIHVLCPSCSQGVTNVYLHY